MRVIIRDTADEASRLAAQQIIDGFTPPGRLGVATGSTPLPLYRELREAYARGEFTLEGSTAWALDEYVGIDKDHPERYRNVLLTELVGNGGTGLAAEDLKTPDGKAEDPEEAARIYEQMIAAQGADPRAPLPRCEHTFEVKAPIAGWLTGMNALSVGLASMRLGAGRAHREDSIDLGAGIECLHKPGEQVALHEPVFKLHASDPALFPLANEMLLESLAFSDSPPTVPPLVIKRIGPTQ